MKKILLALAAAAAMLMTSCGGGMKIEMDNPTNETITVNIDGKKDYTLAPMELIEVKGLKKGEHTMTVNGGAEIKFALETSSLINPTLSTYVTDITEYSETPGDMDTDDWVTVEIDGEEYWGPIEVFKNQPVIKTSDINFGVLTPFKEEIETSKSGSTFLKKLFRKEDFFKYYEEAYY